MKFETLQEIRDYLSQNTIECLICHKQLRRLSHMHVMSHGLTQDEYRERYGIPWSYPLATPASREAVRRTITPAHIANLRPSRNARNVTRRPMPPAAVRHWKEHSRPMGPLVNAQVYLAAPCDRCGVDVTTTKLTMVHGVLCPACAQLRRDAKKLARSMASKQAQASKQAEAAQKTDAPRKAA